MPKATEAEESTTMSVNMTPSQKAAFDKNLAGMGNDSDSDRETENSRAEEECPYGCKYKTGAICLMKAHVKRCPKKMSTKTTSQIHYQPYRNSPMLIEN